MIPRFNPGRLLGGMVVSLAAATAHSQGMNEADMQQMMQRAGELQACMEQVDEAAMQAMQAEGEAKAAEIEALCGAGERDAAQQAAMTWGLEMSRSPQMQQMQTCMQMMREMMPNLPAPVLAPDAESLDAKHICD